MSYLCTFGVIVEPLKILKNSCSYISHNCTLHIYHSCSFKKRLLNTNKLLTFMLLASNKYKVTTQAVKCSTLYNKSGVMGPPRVAKCTTVQSYSSPSPCFRKWMIQWRKMEKSTWEWSSGQHSWEVISEERELTFPFRMHCQLCPRKQPMGYMLFNSSRIPHCLP